jgi:hypothetical protein
MSTVMLVHTGIHLLKYSGNYTCHLDRAIAQAVSRWLPTLAARSGNVGFVGDKVALGAGFL